MNEESLAGVPRLSVIVAEIGENDELPPTLRDLARRGSDLGVEVIFAERVKVGMPLSGVESCDGVVHVRLPDTATLPRLLGAALACAHGEIIAITDTHCEIDDAWATALLRAHESPNPVIGGAVEPGGLRRLVDWAAYLAEYGQFMQPLSEGAATELPGNNISMKRWVLERGCEFVQGEFWKTYWCRQLRAEGIKLQLTSQFFVRYRCDYDVWPFLVRRFHHGRCFAGIRLRQLRSLGRIVYVAGAPILPLLLLTRTLQSILSKRRYLGRLVLALPMIALAMLSWATGEFVGYLAGPDGSCDHVR